MPFGVTLEELYEPPLSSKPRNRLIAQIFYDMGMIEQYGSGTGRVMNACKEANLPAPEFGNYSGGFRILFKLGKPATPHVTPNLIKIIKVCEGDMSRTELQKKLGLKGRMNFKRVYLDPALDLELIEMTKPDAPRSTAQKYRLTEKGKALLKDGE